MFRYILLLYIFIFPHQAKSCTCEDSPLTTETARQAQHIFIFQLLSAKVGTDRDKELTIVGIVKNLDRLRGVGKPPKEIRFSTNKCCGTRLDVGGYFAAFLPNIGESFIANNHVIEIGKEYTVKQSVELIRTILEGHKTLEDAFSREYLDRTEQFPAQPPCNL